MTTVAKSKPKSFKTAYSELEAIAEAFESDDFDSIILDALVLPSAATGDQTIDITLSYKNEFGDPATETHSVPITVFTPSDVPNGNGNGDFYMWLLLIAIVVVVVWWFKFRKPKKK